ncbi:MAG TPA: LPS export ABC transporter permease LptF [Gammaproteobacteria bacterium]|nr:LPS export ABC transporter permease LptF [Gammaproteobacteria bacterium]
MKLSIIDKYLSRELLGSFLSVFLVLLVIVLSTEVVHLLSWVAQGVIPVSAFMSYLMNSFFEFGVILIPLSLLMAILLAFGRLYRDSEMAAIMSAGIGPMQLYRPLMLVVVPASLILLLLLLYVKPLIVQQRAYIAAEIRSQPDVDTLLVGQFNRAGNGVLFLEARDDSKDDNGNDISNVFFQQVREGRNHVDLARGTSNYFDEDGRRYMVMHNGRHYIGDAGEADFSIVQYRDYGIHIARKQVQVHLSESSKTLRQLWGSANPEDMAELQWRFTLPLATLIVAVLALPLSRTDPRGGRYARLALALILYLVYSNLLSVSYTWIEQQKVPLWLGFSWVHIIAIIVTLFVLKRNGYLWKDRSAGTMQGGRHGS